MDQPIHSFHLWQNNEQKRDTFVNQRVIHTILHVQQGICHCWCIILRGLIALTNNECLYNMLLGFHSCSSSSSLPILEFRELRGLLHVTVGKKILSCEYNKVMSFPRKILATKVPPGRKTCVVIFNAYNDTTSIIILPMPFFDLLLARVVLGYIRPYHGDQ